MPVCLCLQGSVSEARAALDGTDVRSIVRERRTVYEHELNRRHVPRVLLSDGTEPGTQTGAAGSAEGTPGEPQPRQA